MKALGFGVGIAALVAGGIALQGLLVMLLLAGLHAYASESIPAVGFIGSTLIGLAIGFVGQCFGGSK